MPPISDTGVYPDINPEAYHSGLFPDSVSYSTLKLLLDEAGPAKYRAAIDGPRTEKKVFDLGTGLHALLLGKGEERLQVLDYPDWHPKAAREARDAAYAAGMTPLLQKDMDALEAVADAVPDHIKGWFTGGTPEVAMLYNHPAAVKVRGQIDYLRDDAIVDLKTVRATDTRTLQRQIYDLRYYLQAAIYRTAYGELTGNWLPYYIVAIDLAAPHLSRTVEITEEYLALGCADLDRAIDIYLDCTASGEWPAYDPEPTQINPPPWAQNILAETQAAAEIAALEQLLGEEQ